MQRVLVVGISGAGKTTYARRLAAALGVPFHEMDALVIGPGWSEPEGFVETIERIAAGEGWVFDSYGHEDVRDAIWARADAIVWLDFPRRVTWPRMVRRSLRRTLRRERIFGGNVETVRMWLDRDHPVWHAWRDHGARRSYLEARVAEARHRHLEVVRFHRVADAERWLRGPHQTGRM